MSPIINKPHLIFWISIPIMILLGQIHGDNILIIGVYDTSIAIANNYLAYLISIFFVLIGFGYWLIYKFKHQLSNWLNLLHIVITVGGFLTVLMIGLIFGYSPIESENTYSNTLRINSKLINLLLTIILGQLIYLTNIIIGLIRKRNITNG